MESLSGTGQSQPPGREGSLGCFGTSSPDSLRAVVAFVQSRQALAQEGSAAYAGIERVRGEIDGRKGTFVFRHSAAGSAGGGDFRVDVVPDSATGDLRGCAASSRSSSLP
jgi:hypothetical protein